MRTPWGDVDRVASRAAGIALPWVPLVLVLSVALVLLFAVHVVALARQLAEPAPVLPGAWAQAGGGAGEAR